MRITAIAGFIGAELLIVRLLDRLDATERVQLIAVAFSSQEMLSPFEKEKAGRVNDIWPGIMKPFLYQAQLRAERFSESESGSYQVPLVHRSVLFANAGIGERVGCVRFGRWSG